MKLKAMPRRKFLEKSGAGLLGMALAPSLMLGRRSSEAHPAAKSPAQSSGRKIRIGVVGGGFGSAFYWHEHPDCIVQAVSDLRPDRRELFMKTYRCGKSYESLEKLILDRNIDAVAVFTGAPDHVRHCAAALRAGKHVLCAVPAAMTIDDCEELIDTVKQTGLTYMMAETSYYQQSVISARKFRERARSARSSTRSPSITTRGWSPCSGRRTGRGAGATASRRCTIRPTARRIWWA